MNAELMRMWIQQVQEAYEGEPVIKSLIQTKLIPGYDKEAAQMSAAGRPATPDHSQLRLLADLARVAHEITNRLKDSKQMPPGPGEMAVSKLHTIKLDMLANTLDQAAKLPAPKSESE